VASTAALGGWIRQNPASRTDGRSTLIAWTAGCAPRPWGRGIGHLLAPADKPGVPQRPFFLAGDPINATALTY